MEDPNVSVASLKFLAGFFREETYNIQYIWGKFAEIMTDPEAPMYFRDDSWEQDWFLAKYAVDEPALGMTSRYLPPSEFHAFPTFDAASCVEQISKATGLTFKQSCAPFQVSALFKEQPSGTLTLPSALEEFYDLRSRIRAQRDPAMTELNQIIAWLNLALGQLFKGLALTPVESNIQQILQVCDQRWSLVWNEKDDYEDHMPVPELIQWKSDVFYGAKLLDVGLDMHPSRQGQSEQWREDWAWLSADTDRELALAAVQKAAQIMVSIPVCLFLQQKFREADNSVTTGHLLAAVIFRRWVLQLQTMAWLENALQQSWQHVRTQDLTTFAFSALRPHWPRRIFGLSHRSIDVKATLSAMRAWSNFRYSIDATSIPHWETNVAQVWGLFSTMPALIRIPSEHYEDSAWCRREREIFEYLRDQQDFLDGRFFIEVPQSNLNALDVVIPEPAGEEIGFFKTGQFPKLTTVFTLFPFEPWENKLLACAAAVRNIFLRLQDAAITNNACLTLARGFAPPQEFVPLTNHPDGWASVMSLFADCQREWGDEADVFPISVLPETYSREAMIADIDRLNTVIDLSDGLFNEADVLAAFEWHRTVLPSVIGNHKYGSFFAIDYCTLTEESWSHDERFMVIRGLNRIRTSIPLWFLQREGQRVDEWKGMGVNPVFTKYVPGQWDWMMELLYSPTWPAEFQKDSKLRFSNKLSAACEATKERGNDYYRGKIN
ncbi:MAG TPA: hypothetical protein VF290_27030 [Pyrinomonadaceae bacterium]